MNLFVPAPAEVPPAAALRMSDLDDVRRIAVLRALPGLGDLLCAVPALRALRARFPRAHVTLVGLPAAEWFVARFGDLIDELSVFPGFPGIPEVEPDPRRIAAFLARMHARELDLAVQLHGSGISSNPFVALLGARRTAGFVLPGLPCPDPELFIPYPALAPEPRRHLALLAHLGAPADDAALAFPLSDDDRAEAAALALPRPFALLNPGAAEPRRRWPVEHFAAVGDGLVARGLAVGVLGAPADAPLAAAVVAGMRAPAHDLAGRTSLGGLGALLAAGAVLVTNDTGTSHLAAAVGAPSVVVFVSSDPARWAPLDRQRHRALGRVVGRAARGDGLHELDPALAPVTPEAALAAAESLLAQGSVPVRVRA